MRKWCSEKSLLLKSLMLSGNKMWYRSKDRRAQSMTQSNSLTEIGIKNTFTSFTQEERFPDLFAQEHLR